MSALNVAIREKRFTQVKLLLDIGVDVNRRGEDRRTALMQLCLLEDETKAAKYAKMLIGHGAKVGLKDKQGLTALCYACKHGQEQIVSILLQEECNFDLNSQDKQGNTAIHYAAMSGNFVVLNLMIKALKRFKLSVDKLNKKGETPLIIASKAGNFLCARILVSEGKASKNARDLIEFKSADEWARTKESLQSASASPFFRVMQLYARSEDSSIRGSLDKSSPNTTSLRPNTAPADMFCESREKNHRENLRELFRVYEGHVSDAFRRGVQPMVVRETSSPPPSESFSQDCNDDFCELPSPTTLPTWCPTSRRFSIRSASKLALSSSSAFRRSSLSPSTTEAKTLNRRGSQSLGFSGRRLSQSMPQVPRIRRGSMNVLSKIVKVPSLNETRVKSNTKMNLTTLPGEEPSPSSVIPDILIAKLQTLAEMSDSEEEEVSSEMLQRSSPANYFCKI